MIEMGVQRGESPSLLSRRQFARVCTAGVLALMGGSSLALSGCDRPAFARGRVREVTDMVGRSVIVPEDIEKVFCSNPIGTVDLYVLAPQAISGWNFRPTGDSKKYIKDEYMALPALGVWMGAGSTPNDEEIVSRDPDAILCFWTADDVGSEMADSVQDETGIGTLAVDYDLRSAPSTIRYVADLLGVGERGEQIAAYCEESLERIARIVETIPGSERKSVYLAQGLGGLSTDPVGSMHVTDALELMGVRNVADLPGTVGKGMGMPTVNLEQIIEWNPDAVLVSEYSMSNSESSDLYGEILTDSHWADVKCIEAGELYRIPQAPFSWFGRPPSIMRMLGCLWVLKVLYPEYAGDIDIVSEARATYRLFFDYELTDFELGELLDTAGIDISTGEARNARA